MATYPAASFFTADDSDDEGEFRTAMDDFLAAVKQQPGAAGIEDITIASGSVTPTRGTVRVEGQGAAADDLVTIVTTNLPDGSLLLLSIKDEGHVITVKHGTGAGNTSLAGGLDCAMNKLEQALLLQRRGTLWYEYARFGREKEHTVGGSGEPAYQNSWTGSTLKFWKDNSGSVHLVSFASHSSMSSAISVIFTLPAGYRPSEDIECAAVALVNGVLEASCVIVKSSGNVEWNRIGAAPSSASVNVKMNNVSFRAAA